MKYSKKQFTELYVVPQTSQDLLPLLKLIQSPEALFKFPEADNQCT